jgi:hypothetical protein
MFPLAEHTQSLKLTGHHVDEAFGVRPARAPDIGA